MKGGRQGFTTEELARVVMRRWTAGETEFDASDVFVVERFLALLRDYQTWLSRPARVGYLEARVSDAARKLSPSALSSAGTGSQPK